jgi:hypothetical protein
MRSTTVRPCQKDAPHTEHAVLCRAFGEVQERCSRVMAQQQAEIERLEAQVLRLRAALVVRETAWMLARERGFPQRGRWDATIQRFLGLWRNTRLGFVLSHK